MGVVVRGAPHSRLPALPTNRRAPAPVGMAAMNTGGAAAMGVVVRGAPHSRLPGAPA